MPFFSLHLITYKNNNSNTHFITHLILLHSKKQEFALFTSWYSSFTGDGKCVICDSYVRPCTLVRICDECNYGSYQGRCVICGGPGVSDAYYCKECTVQEKDVSDAFATNNNDYNRIYNKILDRDWFFVHLFAT